MAKTQKATPEKASPATPPTVAALTNDWQAIPVSYSVTIPKRKQDITDSKGNPVTDKNGKTRTQPVKLEIPATIRHGSYDQWIALYEALGLDPKEEIAYQLNASLKQGNESLKGELRATVVDESKGLADKTNKACLEILAQRPNVKKAIGEFQTAVTENVPRKPVRVASIRKAEINLGAAIFEAAPEIARQIQQMTPEQVASFLQKAMTEGASDA